MKAVLVELGLTVPRTHNLEDLLGLLLPHHASLAVSNEVWTSYLNLPLTRVTRVSIRDAVKQMLRGAGREECEWLFARF